MDEYTEDDTFKRLARPSYNKMHEIFNEWWYDKSNQKTPCIRFHS